ncbi:MAG: hypothetical protein RIM99_08010 [Cyclobacteriaceae bacterium]
MRRVYSIILASFLPLFIWGQDASSLAENAMDLGRSGNYNEALVKIELAIKLDSTNVDFLNTKALYLFQVGNLVLAKEVYGTAISIDSNAISFEGRGLVNYELELFESAINDHTYAVSLAEDNDVKCTALMNRASALMGVRRNSEAYEDLMLAFSIDSMKLEVLTNLGVVCDELGQSEEALNYLLQVVDLDPEYFPAFINIGFIYQKLDEHIKAIYWFNSALDYVENEPLIYSNRSYSKLKSGNIDGALNDIEKSISIYPGNSYAYRNKALILLEMGKGVEACENLNVALEKGFTQSYGSEVEELIAENCF